MKSIIVRYGDLARIVGAMESDRVELVKIQLVPASFEEDELMPAFVHFSGESGESFLDYESLDGIVRIC